MNDQQSFTKFLKEASTAKYFVQTSYKPSWPLATFEALKEQLNVITNVFPFLAGNSAMFDDMNN